MSLERFSLNGKTALVMGGRGYLGRNFCQALAEAGAYVYSADLAQASPASRGAAAIKDHERIIQRTVNVTEPSSVNDVVDAIAKERGGIDILVYSVAAKCPDFYKPYTECSLEGWQYVFKAELDGMFLSTQAVGRHMEKAQKGSIILLSSIYGVVGNDQRIYEGSNLADVYGDNKTEKPKRIFAHASYAAVKGAHISMARFLAAYWGEKNIRVNTLSPGGVGHKDENETFVKKYTDRVPLGRKATIDDITGAVLYLASDAAGYVTGHNMLVDGGWTAW